MKTIDNRIARLPKWAQQRLEAFEVALREANTRIASLKANVVDPHLEDNPKTRGQKLAEILEQIRQKCVCAYMNSEHFCDCKFGAGKVGTRTESGNGCPEMRDAIWLLQNMTDAEFKEISERRRCGHFFDANHR